MQTRKTGRGVLSGLLLLLAAMTFAGAEDYYTEPQVYGIRPSPRHEFNLGPIGATGIRARIYKGVRVSVDSVDAGSPADGHFKRGDVILDVNGEALEGRNPFPVLGAALTEAEATDGKLSFEIESKDGKTKTVAITIPILGAYAETFPLECEKSKKIIRAAAEFYADADRMQEHDMWNALACLFLLSTGDDKYVPRVKQYFSQFLTEDGEVTGLEQHTWYNGYNGVAVAEYYLRTGDKSVLPILQYYCDDAKERQKYGVGWSHWGHGANPSYEAGGGMMHGAGTQMVLTMVLGKMCGVEVDEKTLLGSLKHWYRFAGHGAIPVSDQRYYHIFRSAGRDGGTAAIMHIAAQATGDVGIYEKAKEYLAMSVLTSWPSRNYDWETYWHSLSGQFMRDYNPAMYYQTMQRFRWRYDLGRGASGGFYFADRAGTQDASQAGIALALAYTAPLRNLQITGAERSKFAVDFTLPEHLWGTDADLAFLTSKHHKDFYKFGADEEIHIPYWQLPVELRYTPAMVKDLPLDMMRKNVRHARATIRTAAAKALAMNGHLDELEALLKDPDPRLRRAGLDGLNDSRPWFTGPVTGQYAVPAKAYTPGMTAAINSIMTNPDESWFVTEGALYALSHAPLEVIKSSVPNIMPWTTHEDWWLREAAFRALMGLQEDEATFVNYLPTLIDMMVKEYRYNPRHQMMMQLRAALEEAGTESRVGKMILAGFTRAAMESTVLPDVGDYKRSIEGTVNIVQAVQLLIVSAPEEAAALAKVLVDRGRLETLTTGALMNIVKDTADHKYDKFVGLLPALQVVPEEDRAALSALLYDVFRPELIRRHQASEKPDMKLIDLIVELTQLRKPDVGWQAVGTPKPAERMWRYYAFDVLKEEEKLHPRIGSPNRLRDVTMPAGTEAWYAPEFDDSGWARGHAPIGVGVFKAHGHGRGWTARPDFAIENKSAWGEKEFLLMRTTFEVEKPDYDYYRISVLADQGFHIYLNGEKIHTYIWFIHYPMYRKILLTQEEIQHLKKGVNSLAAQGVIRYEKDAEGEGYHHVGQMDVVIEGLRVKDLGM